MALASAVPGESWGAPARLSTARAFARRAAVQRWCNSLARMEPSLSKDPGAGSGDGLKRAHRCGAPSARRLADERAELETLSLTVP